MDGVVVDQVLLGETHVRVFAGGSGGGADGWTLWWSDMVANDWEEWYPDLSTALVRLAAIVYCGECDWRPGFAHEAEEFQGRAEEFLREVAK